MKKRVVGIIGTNGLPGKYGGWDQLVNHLTVNLKNEFNFIVYTSKYNAEPGLKTYNEAKLKIINLKANGIQSVFYDMLSLIHACFKCDTLFICGTSGCIFLPFIKLSGKKIILNPDGLEWKRKKWSKPVKWFLKISESIGIRFSDVVVSDNEKITEYIKAEYNKNSELIEYGGDHVIKGIKLSDKTSKYYNIQSNRYAFKVCRIEPENNIHVILEAFVNNKIPLIIVGNWTYSKYGETLRNKYALFSNIQMLDAIYDQVILDELRNNCLIYIHGHSVGGTNPSLVEAMNLGLAVVAFNVPFNIVTTENEALFFTSANDLKLLLINIYENKIDLNIIRNKMSEIASRRYIWNIVTKKYSLLFHK
jgi:glycosyltransferase involved in cell wall biosynthesis